MKARWVRNIGSVSLSMLIITSTLVIISSVSPKVAEADTAISTTTTSSVSNEFAAASDIPIGSASTTNTGASVPACQVIAASGNNRFVVWYDDTPGNYDIFFRRSTDNGATWQPTVNLSTNPGPSENPQIAVSGSNVYVTWIDWPAGNQEILLRRSTDNGATWKAVKNLSNNAGAGEFQRIAASGSNVYVIWVDFTFEIGNGEIFFKRSTDNGATWKAVKVLSKYGGDSYYPSIAVLGSNVYVTWSDFTSGEVFFRRSTDNGATLQSMLRLSNTAGGSFDPRLTAVGSNVYIAWVDTTPGNYDIFLRRSTDNGVTWKPIKNLSSNGGVSFLGDIAG